MREYVVDWRPSWIATSATSAWTAGHELAVREYLVIDESTEDC